MGSVDQWGRAPRTRSFDGRVREGLPTHVLAARAAIPAHVQVKESKPMRVLTGPTCDADTRNEGTFTW